MVSMTFAAFLALFRDPRNQCRVPETETQQPAKQEQQGEVGNGSPGPSGCDSPVAAAAARLRVCLCRLVSLLGCVLRSDDFFPAQPESGCTTSGRNSEAVAGACRLFLCVASPKPAHTGISKQPTVALGPRISTHLLWYSLQGKRLSLEIVDFSYSVGQYSISRVKT